MPLTKDDLAIIYSDQEVIDVLTDDGVRVSIQSLAPIYLAHQYKIRNVNNYDTMTIKVKLQSNVGCSTAPIYLQIWNIRTLLWETIAVDEETLEQTTTTLSAVISTNLSDYYDEVHDSHFPFIYDINEIAIRVYQHITA